MIIKPIFPNKSSKELDDYLNNANFVYKKNLEGKLKPLGINNYKYSIDKAMNELGLDYDLIQELIEEFVLQIIDNKSLFLNYIEQLKINKKKFDYTNLRDLAHKNLGVARNLRIDDAQILLNELMTKEDLDYLRVCVETLEACIIKLKPEIAFNADKQL